MNLPLSSVRPLQQSIPPMKDTLRSSARAFARAALRPAFALALAGLVSASAATVNGTLNKDVTAKEKFPTTNYGADAILQVSAQTGYTKYVYLQFTVSGIPAGATGISAQLKLRSQTTGTGRSITAHAVTSTSWTESALNWSNKPALGTALSTVSSHTSGADSVWAVGAHVTGNGTFALGLDGTYSGDTTFSSKEGSNAPVLVVTYTPPAAYAVYWGNTHAHTTYTVSHGGVPPDNGPPSGHYTMARNAANNMDFYVTTDHSQETTFHPTSATNAAWVNSKADATAATDSTFVALTGYEHSENNGDSQGPNPGNGHINVINTNTYLDALESPVDLPYLYNWLANTAQPNGTGLPIVASFNHPGLTQYNNWAYRTAAATDIITLLEVINSNDSIHESSYRAANNAGWKVSPTSGNDNHGFWGMNWKGTVHNSRVGVLATALTKAAILDAMKNRRTFATRNKNLALHYTANGVIMGSTLSSPGTITFVVTATDPDTGTNNNITLIEVVRPDGTVAASFTPPAGSYSVNWTSTAVSVGTNKYFYVRARNAEFGATAMGWAAPIWTGL